MVNGKLFDYSLLFSLTRVTFLCCFEVVHLKMALFAQNGNALFFIYARFYHCCLVFVDCLSGERLAQPIATSSIHLDSAHSFQPQSPASAVPASPPSYIAAPVCSLVSCFLLSLFTSIFILSVLLIFFLRRLCRPFFPLLLCTL